MLLYDTIVNQYNEYTAYNEIFEKEKERLQEARKGVLNRIVNGDKENIDEEIEKLVFESVLQQNLYRNDVQLLFINLFKSIESYKLIEDSPDLPKEITDLCQELEFTVPKTVFIVDKGVLKERVEGITEKIKTNLYNSGELKRLTEQLKNTQG
jgi:hypothetical protein